MSPYIKGKGFQFRRQGHWFHTGMSYSISFPKNVCTVSLRCLNKYLTVLDVAMAERAVLFIKTLTFYLSVIKTPKTAYKNNKTTKIKENKALRHK